MTHAHRSATPVSTHDTTRIDDTRIKAVRPLITPALLQEWLPPTEAALALVESSRAAISRVLHGQDDRLVVVVGPCSIHDHAQAMEYAHALKVQADALQDDLLVVMRVYFEKPRTTVGWKGYINDPHLDGSFAINEGLELARIVHGLVVVVDGARPHHHHQPVVLAMQHARNGGTAGLDQCQRGVGRGQPFLQQGGRDERAHGLDARVINACGVVGGNGGG